MAASKLDPNFVIVKERVPLLGKGVDNLLSLLRKVLEENRSTQKVVLEVGKPIYLEKLMPKDATNPDQLGLSLADIIRQRPMEEYLIDEKLSPPENLLVMFQQIEREGYVVSHALIAPVSALNAWMTMPRRNEYIFSVPLFRLGDLPRDVLILGGSPVRNADSEDIEFLVKTSIP